MRRLAAAVAVQHQLSHLFATYEVLFSFIQWYVEQYEYSLVLLYQHH